MKVNCAYCGKLDCMKESYNELQQICPMNHYSDEIELNNELYMTDDENKMIANVSAQIEAEGYKKWNRLEETIRFAAKMNYNHIGLAHCNGLRKEASIVQKIFETNSFEVSSACCKIGGLEKTEIGIDEKHKLNPDCFESACNPINQARILEDNGADFILVIGLCVGHDSLLIKHANVPVSVLVVKDRVTGHNPAAAIYTVHTYNKNLLDRRLGE